MAVFKCSIMLKMWYGIQPGIVLSTVPNIRMSSSPQQGRLRVIIHNHGIGFETLRWHLNSPMHPVIPQVWKKRKEKTRKNKEV